MKKSKTRNGVQTYERKVGKGGWEAGKKFLILSQFIIKIKDNKLSYWKTELIYDNVKKWTCTSLVQLDSLVSFCVGA